MAPILLCVATDGYGAFWDFCLESHRRYCAQHNISYHLIDEAMQGLNGKWTKLLAARALLAAGHDVFLIDADAEIASTAPHFVSAMSDQNKSIFIARGISGRPNSGVMLLRGGAKSGAMTFLDACLTQREQPIDTDCFVTAEGENGHIIHLLKREPHSVACHFLERSWNCSIPEEAATSYVRHFTNHLREKLENAMWQTEDMFAITTATPAKAKLQSEWQSHRLTRHETLQRLENDARLLETLRQLVVRSAGHAEFPPLVHDNAYGWLWRHEFTAGLLETPTALLLQRLCHSGSVFLDAGAHVGYFSMLLAKGPAAPHQLLAIEAHPKNFEILSRNLAGTPSTCLHAALADSNGTIELLDGQGHSNSTIFAGNPTTGAKFQVKKTTIDAAMRDAGLQTVDLMKIDIEGAEPLALQGATETLAASPDIVVVVESNPALLKLGGFRPIDLARLMERHGLFGREIRDDFMFGPSGYISSRGTLNMAYARKQRWTEIAELMKQTAAS